MSPSEADYAAWLGRQERRRDIVTAERMERFAATFDEVVELSDGDKVHPLSHWTLFLPLTRQSELGPDGHARRGGFLPPVHDLPRRMWAGGRLTFHAPLRVGMQVERLSEIASVKARQGSAGPLVFVTVRHEVREAGQTEILLTEEHDIVYRGLEGRAVRNAPDEPAAAVWEQRIDPDEPLLFRYSALTFNTHRIHYDRRYTMEVEGYPGLVVHGPLQATLLVDLLRKHLPGSVLKQFSFRALSPVFDGPPIFARGVTPDEEGRVLLWMANSANGVAMQAEAVVA